MQFALAKIKIPCSFRYEIYEEPLVFGTMHGHFAEGLFIPRSRQLCDEGVKVTENHKGAANATEQIFTYIFEAYLPEARKYFSCSF